MTNSIVLLNEYRDELIIYVRPDAKKKDGYIHMRFNRDETATAIYHTIKKASSLKYDFGKGWVRVEISGLALTEISSVAITKFKF